jgi:hypothetical protein
MLNLKLTLALVAGLALSALSLGVQDPKPKVRLGTYDSRAIAVAYAPSLHNPVASKMKEHAAAKAAGDQAKVAELEAWGAAHQRQLHRQGFALMPVDDLLAPVSHELPRVAREVGVDAIVFGCSHAGPGVELVDVTMQLVELYAPNERTLGFVRDVLKAKPLSLDAIDAHKD